jgi:hypothetical protein
LLLIWLLVRLGFDKRALAAWTVLAAGLLLVCYFFTPPAGAHRVNTNIPININYVYGFNDQQPQTWANQNLYVVLWFGVLWLVAYLPTYLTLRRIFAVPPGAGQPETPHPNILIIPAGPTEPDSRKRGRVTPHGAGQVAG